MFLFASPLLMLSVCLSFFCRKLLMEKVTRNYQQILSLLLYTVHIIVLSKWIVLLDGKDFFEINLKSEPLYGFLFCFHAIILRI